MQPELKAQELNLGRHHFEKKKKSQLSLIYHCSLLLVLLAITEQPPKRCAKFLAGFIEIAWDYSVISGISADLSCSAATLPRVPEEIISCTKWTTFPLDGKATQIAQKVIDTYFSCHQPRGYWGFSNYECD